MSGAYLTYLGLLTNFLRTKLAQKRKRQSISKREYLISLKELNSCQASVENLEKSFLEKKQSFESTYDISFSSYEKIDSSHFFEEFAEQYGRFRDKKQSLNLENKDELKLLETQVRSMSLKKKELSAQDKLNLSLEEPWRY